MGKKVNPKIIRLPLIENWGSKWFSKINGGNKSKYQANLKEDWLIRKTLQELLKNAAVEKIEIKRSPRQLNIIIHSARPGLIIGKGGKEIEILKRRLRKIIGSETIPKIDVIEIRKPEYHAKLIARSIAEQLEKRMPYRRVLKRTLAKVPLDEEIQGVKIKVSGRLNGAEIARSEWLGKGRMPLSSLRAQIDFAQDIARTTYGTIGVKVWLYKGEKFNE